MTDQLLGDLPVQATRARLNVLRMLRAAGSGHLGGALSCIDILTALYGRVLNVDAANPDDPDRDRFLLSAGHKALAQYAVLAEFGFFPEEVLDTYGEYKSRLPGHPDMHKLPGVEANTGALGHGVAIAIGMAIAGRIDGSDRRVFAVVGDGELAEGSNWEAFAAAAHHGVDNLVVFFDCNGFQISGPTADVMDMGPVAAKLAAFGWATREVDGHDFGAILDAVESGPLTPGKPTAIVAHTVKGNGISFLAGRLDSHYWTPADGELDRAVAELEALVRQHSLEVVGG
ncbi:transketolase [Microbacterium aureliae]